jgi:signal transduction histidine kinase/DNA-binding response OmpR family regulator
MNIEVAKKFGLNTFRNLIYALGFIFLFTCTHESFGQEIRPFEIREFQHLYDLTESLYVYTDTSKQLTFEELLSGEYNQHFTQYTKGQLLDASQVHWAIFKIKGGLGYNQRYTDWRLFLGNANFIEVHVMDSSQGNITLNQSGTLFPALNKHLAFGNKIQRIPISLDLTNEYTIGLRAKTIDHHDPLFDISLKQTDFFESLDFVISTRRDWFFLGFMATMILLNLILYFETRFIAYLFHGLFILGITTFTLDYFGVTDDLGFIRDHPLLVQAVDYIGLLLMDIAYFQFARFYLNLKSIMPRWDRLFYIMIWAKVVVFITISIFYYTTVNEPLADKWLSAFLCAEYLLILVFLFPLFRRGGLKGTFFISGTLILFLAITLNAISIINARGIWTLMTELGMVGETFCFMMGLGIRFKELREEESEAARLKELDDFKTKLYTNITHEFRTPLTVISGLSETGNHKDNIPSTYSNIFKTIHASSNKLLRLVNDMLDLAKLEKDNVELDLHQYDIVKVVNLAIQSFQAYASNKGMKLTVEPHVESFYMDLDLNRFKMIIDNLISNAIKHSSRGDRISIQTHQVIKDGEDKIVITVSDTGAGFEKRHIPYIFDRYYQIDQGNSRSSVGTGIGLSLVKELITLMSGDISVSSVINEGTTFTVVLPVSHDFSVHPLPDDIFYTQGTESGNLERITPDFAPKDAPLLLVVEDDPDLMDYITQLLASKYKIRKAYNGEEGVRMAQSIIPDLVISDVMMPIKDGFALCSELKSDDKTSHIPIILLTAKAEVQDRLEGLETGADAYLTKPFHRAELMVRLDKLLELRRTLQKKFSQFALVENHDASDREGRFIIQINSIINEHLQDSQFGVEQLAKEAAMSRMQLHRKLTALSNRSASNYIRNFRLHKARPLLMDESINISEVAWEVGFQDAGYFTKSFQKEFGITPSKFRQKGQ